MGPFRTRFYGAFFVLLGAVFIVIPAALVLAELRGEAPATWRAWLLIALLTIAAVGAIGGGVQMLRGRK